jgi:uncharacterized membrane protein
MAYADQVPPQPPAQKAVSDTTLAMIIYVLYFVSYFFILTAVVGVIMAYVQVNTADPMLQTHYRFQIRTFWIGLLYFVAGVILCFVFVGIFVLLWWFIWTLIRSIKGILALNEGRPIAQPESWMFG